MERNEMVDTPCSCLLGDVRRTDDVKGAPDAACEQFGLMDCMGRRTTNAM